MTRHLGGVFPFAGNMSRSFDVMNMDITNPTVYAQRPYGPHNYMTRNMNPTGIEATKTRELINWLGTTPGKIIEELDTRDLERDFKKSVQKYEKQLVKRIRRTIDIAGRTNLMPDLMKEYAEEAEKWVEYGRSLGLHPDVPKQVIKNSAMRIQNMLDEYLLEASEKRRLGK